MGEKVEKAVVRSRGAGISPVDLAVWESGPRDAPAIVLIHGWPDSHVVWDPLVSILERSFRVVRYDVRGAGESLIRGEPPDSAYSLEALSADLAAVARSVGDANGVHVVGHDWGGIQAWEALADPSHKGLFATFTVISGPCLDHIGYWMRHFSTEMLGQKLRQAAASWYVAAFHMPGFPALTRRFVRKQAKRYGMSDGEPRDGLAEDAFRGTALYRANMRQRLFSPRERRVDIPVLQLVPEHDPHVTPVLAHAADPWVGELYRPSIPGGHWVVRKHPERIAGPVETLVDAHAQDRVGEALSRLRVR